MCVCVFELLLVSPIAQGLQGDTILVAGVNTGTAKVQARLMDRVWKVCARFSVHSRGALTFVLFPMHIFMC